MKQHCLPTSNRPSKVGVRLRQSTHDAKHVCTGAVRASKGHLTISTSFLLPLLLGSTLSKPFSAPPLQSILSNLMLVIVTETILPVSHEV